MIVNCPTCQVGIKLDPVRLGGKRLTIRCSRCRQVFKTDIEPAVQAGNCHVLVAHSDEELCSTISEILIRAGISCDIYHEGYEALKAMEDNPPGVALVDVALPGLYAFEVIDTVRRRPGLQDVKIILLSSVYNKAAYKRHPSSLYGADDYLEKHHLVDQLVEKVRRLGVMTGEGSSRVSDPVTAGVPPDGDTEADYCREINAKVQEAEAHEVSSNSGSAVLEKAQRLARIIVSDIALYNQERVEEGILSNTFFKLLEPEIAEGRRLFEEKVPQKLREGQDLLQEAFEAFIERRRSELR